MSFRLPPVHHQTGTSIMPGIKKTSVGNSEIDSRDDMVHANGMLNGPVIKTSTLSNHTKTPPPGKMKRPVERMPLPVDSYCQKLLSEFTTNDTCIVVAETGSGKTTRIPQFVIEHGLDRITGLESSKSKQIIITQPRRIAAITVAERVAKEMNCTIGEEVGYCVRFDEMYTRQTRIVFMTDGMLLRKMRDDPTLEHCGMLMIDEVHERSVNTDILLGCARRIQKQRTLKSPDLDAENKLKDSTTTSQANDAKSRSSPLKLVLMSATMDVDNFRNYFVGCRVLYLEGRQFPVEVQFAAPSENALLTDDATNSNKMLAVGQTKPSRVAVVANGNTNGHVNNDDDDDSDDYFHKTLAAIFQIHLQFPNDGDVLVFLTGADEINAMCKRCRTIAHHMSTTHPNAAPIHFKELYASLPKDRQEELFLPRKSPPADEASNKKPFSRRVILSTNVAETSVTIPNIKYVIDTGKAKVRQRISETAVERLSIVDISQASAMQRAGRSGRQQPGFCFRLYSQDSYDRRELYTKPEILRCSLSAVVMQMLALKLRNISKFSFLDRPPDDSFEQAFRELWWLGALKQMVVEKDDEIDAESGGSSLSITSTSSTTSSSSRSSSTVRRTKSAATESDSTATPAPLSRMQLKWTLSVFGKRMTALPVEPRYGACIVHSLQLQCTEEIIVIIAMLSAESNIFVSDDIRGAASSDAANRTAAPAFEDEFNCYAGDLTSLLKVWRQFCKQKAMLRKDWCHEKRINFYSMYNAGRVRDQLRQLVWNSIPELHAAASATNSAENQIVLPHSNDLTVIRRCLCKGLFMNAATLNQQSNAGRAVYETVDRRYTTIKIHPSSVLAPHNYHTRRGGAADRAPPKCIVFVELVQSNELYARNCVLADEKWLEEDEKCAGYYRESREIMLKSNTSNRTRDI